MSTLYNEENRCDDYPTRARFTSDGAQQTERRSRISGSSAEKRPLTSEGRSIEASSRRLERKAEVQLCQERHDLGRATLAEHISRGEAGKCLHGLLQPVPSVILTPKRLAEHVPELVANRDF